jgi:uncharacterized DUF497 family protein
MLSFVWDEEKNKINLEKHGISFAEAKGIFYDEHARLIADEDNSEDEERFLLLGMSFRPRLLLVCHCYRENDHVIRIISARKTTRRESQMYRRFKQ